MREIKKKGNYCIYLVEKQCNVHYKVLKLLLNSLIQSESGETPVNMSRDTVNSLLKLAESDAEKLRLKYAVVKVGGLSSSKAKSVHGFSDMSCKVSQVENALEEAIESIAKVKDEALARSLGVYVATTKSSSSDRSETDSDYSD